MRIDTKRLPSSPSRQRIELRQWVLDIECLLIEREPFTLIWRTYCAWSITSWVAGGGEKRHEHRDRKRHIVYGSGRTFLLSGLLYELSRCTNSPFARARRYVETYPVISRPPFRDYSERLTRGVVSNLVACRQPPWTLTKRAPVCASAMAASENAGMLERLTVLLRNMSVTEKVALRRGSFQQGKARRASVS